MQIDKALLEKLLAQPISSFTTAPGTKPGDNVAGSLESIRVSLPSGESLHLINKTRSDDPEFAEYATRFGVFATENAVYQEVAPRVHKLLESRGLSPAPSLPIPKFIGGRGNIGGEWVLQEEEFLCMEDVRPLGYSMKDKHLAFNLPEVLLILQELAKWHASTHFLIVHQGERIFEESAPLRKLKESPFSSNNPVMSIVGKEMFSAELESAARLLEISGESALGERVRSGILAKGKDFVGEEVMRRGGLTDKETFPCIIHGDLWVNNILLKYDPSTSLPISLRFVDFQQTRRGNIYEDLVYFMLTSTTPEFRKGHLAQVLNNYYEAFEGRMRGMGADMPIGFTRGKLIDTFYGLLLGGYVYMTFAIPLQLAEPLKKEEEVGKKEVDAKKEEGPEQMLAVMIAGLAERSAKLHKQMLKSPRAVARLIDISREMAEMRIF